MRNSKWFKLLVFPIILGFVIGVPAWLMAQGKRIETDKINVFAVVSDNLAGPANGVYSFIVNLIGFLPSPYFYAVLKKIFKKESYTILLLMFYGFIGCFELAGADIYMRAKKIRLYRQKIYSFKEEN